MSASKPSTECWCGAVVIHEEWCHEHAPRCRSGAHFKGECRCAGSAIVDMKIDSFMHMIGQRVKNYDEFPTQMCTTAGETRKMFRVLVAAVKWSRDPLNQIDLDPDDQALLDAVRGLR